MSNILALESSVTHLAVIEKLIRDLVPLSSHRDDMLGKFKEHINMIYNFRSSTFESLFPTQAFIFLEENLLFIIFVLKTGNRFSKWHDIFQNRAFWFELLSKM